MSDAASSGPDPKQARAKEFLALFPVTMAIAGLPPGRTDQLFTADQMEARVLSLKTAYKLARTLLRDASEQ